MKIKAGDPILSPSGKEVIAFFTEDRDLRHGNSVELPVVSDFSKTPTGPEFSAGDKLCTATFYVHAEMPDKTYWLVSPDAAPGWERGSMFKRVPVSPSTSPAGMVAAYDLVLADKKLTPMAEVELQYIREVWSSRVKYEESR